MGIIHRDLAARNILLDGKMNAVVGLSLPFVSLCGRMVQLLYLYLTVAVLVR